MIFKLYDCDVGIKYNSVSYDFEHIDEVQIDDPEFTRLVRGANGSSKMGLAYKEGLKEPKRITCTIANMSVELKAALDNAFNNKDRLDVFVISRSDGSGKLAKNAVLCQQPQQLTLNDSPDSMNVALIFESFDLAEAFKS